jgi:hypothetical protein
LYERVLQYCCCCEGGDCCGGGGVTIREQRSRARSRRGGVSENEIAGAAAARLFFLTAVAIAIATRPFKYHENSVTNTTSSFVSWIHSFVHTALETKEKYDVFSKKQIFYYSTQQKAGILHSMFESIKIT